MLKLYRPTISNNLTQPFGTNKACIYPNGKVTAKIGGKCPSNSREFYTSIGMKGHNGLDLATWHGEPVFHAGLYEGRMKIEKDFSGGIGVDVISTYPVALQGGREVYVKTRYWHLKTPIGHDGKIVRLGEIIGLADNTGASSGDHLHFGLKVCDEDGNALEKGNGYNGAIDPWPYIDLKVDAKTAAEYLYNKAPKLSKKERQEMLSQLSLARQLLLALLELKRKV